MVLIAKCYSQVTRVDHTVLTLDSFKDSIYNGAFLDSNKNYQIANTETDVRYKVTILPIGCKRYVKINTVPILGSWTWMIKKWIKSNDHLIRILSHEQGHVDISEILANNIKFSVESFNYSPKNEKYQADSIIKNLHSIYAFFQRKYKILGSSALIDGVTPGRYDEFIKTNFSETIVNSIAEMNSLLSTNPNAGFIGAIGGHAVVVTGIDDANTLKYFDPQTATYKSANITSFRGLRQLTKK